MKLRDILEGIGIRSIHADPEMEIAGIAYDSRAVEPGQLFVAVTGFAADGHRFIPMAVEKGAAAVLCQTPPEGEIPYVQVENTRSALALASANFFGRPAEKMKFIGITGTNGKTTSTYLLKEILEKTVGAKVGLVGTIQNMIGDQVLETERTTPESYELQKLFADMAEAGCTHVVMEVSSHALVLDRVAGVRFDVGMFSNLTQDHLDFHKTMEEYRKAKAILFRMCDVGVYNADDPASEKIMAEATCRAFTYAEHHEADLQAENVVLHADSVEFTAVHGGERVPVTLGIPGGFTVYNALCVLGAAMALGISLSDAAAALAGAHGVKGRVEVVPTPGRDYTVLIDYAHTPDSLENVLTSVRGYCKGRLISVFGCGGDRDNTKRPIMGRIGAQLSDIAVITSDNPRTEDPNQIIEQILAGISDRSNCVVVENRRRAIREAMAMAKKDDIIVLCGKGHETYQILGTEKTHLDEREEVAAALREQEEL
ncbi:MAG: UDP-N-acetylmuramoyl-L-alanyl-D-glutamate--2,6-diaminopimelate ligase [Oscillospiraceae bacterium]|nr:UDP-N-acetylmuramoyl-L-alanyl-D-glutamate--2,6-diaminopimelate ligase [Oscillospiraceae bacterium]